MYLCYRAEATLRSYLQRQEPIDDLVPILYPWLALYNL